MKYNDVKVKEYLTADEYQDIVSAMYNIQFYVDDDGSLVYQPELLTMTLPSILAHTCLEGIEWEDGENIMYSNELADRIMNDAVLYNVIEPLITGITDGDITLPYYLVRAAGDVEKKIANMLNCNRPSDQFAKALVKILDDLGQIGEIIKTDNGKALVEALQKAAENG